jgi:hypothetical protein
VYATTLVASLLLLMSPTAAGAVVTTFGCANPTSCTLAELFGGGSIRVQTKLFDDWELESIDLDGVLPNFALVVVEGKDDGGLVPVF